MKGANEKLQEGNTALQCAITQITGMYGRGAVMRLGDIPEQSQAIIPTGIESLDVALGIGGIPKGRIVEIFGPEGSGKTALALQIARQLQGVAPALYIDADHGLSPYLLSCSGIVPGGMFLADAETLEGALGICETAAPAFGAVIIDTLTALPTRLEVECSAREWIEPTQAKVLSRALPRLAGALLMGGCTLILVNQMRDITGVRCGAPERSTGGRALKYYAAVRVEMRRLEVSKKGQIARAAVIKNKCAPPFKAATIEIVYGEGMK